MTIPDILNTMLSMPAMMPQLSDAVSRSISARAIVLRRCFVNAFAGFTIYRTLLIWPYALSPNIAGVIGGLMLEPTIGMLTNGLRFINIHFNWRGDAISALIFIAAAATWKMLGYNIIFFLDGIQGLPK